MLGIPLEVKPADVPEIPIPGELPLPLATRLARAKASSVPGQLVLGADTIVVIGGEVLGKPVDEADALRMLQLLQGRTHEVVTAVALKAGDQLHEAVDVTRVKFRPLSERFIRDYIATGEPMDKAGAYGIQGFGAVLVDKVDGDFYNVMGLPIRLVLELLRRAGMEYRFGKG